jgi:hypothetical protein
MWRFETTESGLKFVRFFPTTCRIRENVRSPDASEAADVRSYRASFDSGVREWSDFFTDFQKLTELTSRSSGNRSGNPSFHHADPDTRALLHFEAWRICEWEWIKKVEFKENISQQNSGHLWHWYVFSSLRLRIRGSTKKTVVSRTNSFSSLFKKRCTRLSEEEHALTFVKEGETKKGRLVEK